MNVAPVDRLAAAKALVDEGRKLLATQEQEVARMRATGLDPTRAQSLLEAYRVSLLLAEQELAEAAASMERAERPAQPARGKR
jgi:hypothetical protein